MFRNKIPFGQIVLFFLRMFRILPFFSIIHMIRIRFFVLRDHFSRSFGRHSITQDEKAWWLGCLERPELQGNLMRCFHVTMFFRFADPASVWNHFLMETRIICLIKQDLNELVRQEHQVGSLNNCIDELQQEAYAQRLELEDAQHGNIESRQEQTTLQEELTVTEKVLRKTQIRNIHEMEKRTELKNYKLKNSQYKNWEKVMKQYRSSFHKSNKCKSKRILNYSGEFQEVESNYSGGLSYFSSQPAVPLDTWNTSGQQEYVLGIQFSTVDPRYHYQGIHHFATPGSTGPTKYCTTFLQATGTGTHFPGHED